MKKLMMAFAVAAVSAVASASAVSWGVATGTVLDSAKVDTGKAYLMYTTGAFDASVFSTLKSFDASSLAAAGLTDTMDTFDYSASKLNNSVSLVPTSKLNDGATAIGGGNKNFYVVVIDDGGKDLAYIATSANIQNSPMSVTATKPGTNFTYVQASSGDVPEPTSGLLLLLGVAGLALRRRHA